MPKVKETWMDVITTEMMEHICDDLCKYPDQLSEMELISIHTPAKGVTVLQIFTSSR